MNFKKLKVKDFVAINITELVLNDTLFTD